MIEESMSENLPAANVTHLPAANDDIHIAPMWMYHLRSQLREIRSLQRSADAVNTILASYEGDPTEGVAMALSQQLDCAKLAFIRGPVDD